MLDGTRSSPVRILRVVFERNDWQFELTKFTTSGPSTKETFKIYRISIYVTVAHVHVQYWVARGGIIAEAIRKAELSPTTNSNSIFSGPQVGKEWPMENLKFANGHTELY